MRASVFFRCGEKPHDTNALPAFEEGSRSVKNAATPFLDHCSPHKSGVNGSAGWRWCHGVFACGV